MINLKLNRSQFTGEFHSFINYLWNTVSHHGKTGEIRLKQFRKSKWQLLEETMPISLCHPHLISLLRNTVHAESRSQLFPLITFIVFNSHCIQQGILDNDYWGDGIFYCVFFPIYLSFLAITTLTSLILTARMREVFIIFSNLNSLWWMTMFIVASVQHRVLQNLHKQ